MLPDGAETQLDDWTVFFLNQTSFNTISPVLALDTPEVKAVGLPGEDAPDHDKPDLLCVLNLVRTKHDKTWDRCVLRLWESLTLGSQELCVEERRFSHWRFAHDTLLFRFLRYVYLCLSHGLIHCHLFVSCSPSC